MRVDPIAEMSEATWQEQFIDLAQAHGWKHMHVRRSIGKGRKWTTATNVSGYPDLTLWNQRQKRIIFVELKSEKGVASSEQREVLGELRNSGQEVYILRPSDLALAQKILAPQPKSEGDSR
jgi:hypothetical protein